MVLRRLPEELPEEFAAVTARLRMVTGRPEVTLEEVPAPQRVAPHAFALAADLVRDDEELANGRFVLLHDPAQPETWQGAFRAVTFVRAELEAELGADPMVGQVGWSWLEEALRDHGAAFTALGGTVTRVVSEAFGALSDRPVNVEIEIRASWTPLDDPACDLKAWTTLLSTVGGLPPLPAGVSPLRHHQH